jgi:hypothetical protein
MTVNALFDFLILLPWSDEPLNQLPAIRSRQDTSELR